MAGYTLIDPQTYFAEDGRQGEDASCIGMRLPVGKLIDEPRGALGYWPRYRELSPAQRANYLAWMAGGRTTPLKDIGYAFIYFYGLERRALVDNEDLLPVLCEVTRLLLQYPAEGSFQSYGQSFVAHALARAGLDKLSSPWFHHLLEQEHLRDRGHAHAPALAWFYLHGKPLPVAWAQRIAARDGRSQRSVVRERVREQFDALYAQKYADRFGEGLILKAAAQDLVCSYHPGSPSLLGTRAAADAQAPVRIPNVLGAATQFDPLVELWNECVADLRPLSRQLAKGGSITTRAAWEALPPELRLHTEHPDAERWRQLFLTHSREDGVALLRVSALLPLLNREPGSKLTHKASVELAQTASAVGFVIEPDARRSGRAYLPEEHVAVFGIVPEEETPVAGRTYAAASRLLELGYAMAAADGEVEETERIQIARFIEAHFQLTPAEDRRLSALQLLFREHPPALTVIGSRLQKLLSAEQRASVGRFVVGIAAANGTIDPGEFSALRKVARSLDLEWEQMRELVRELLPQGAGLPESQRVCRLGPAEAAQRGDAAAEVSGVVLNEERLRAILHETRQVAELLTAAMAEDEDEPEVLRPDRALLTARGDADGGVLAGEPGSANSFDASCPKPLQLDGRVPLDGLDGRFHALLEELARRNEWPVVEFAAMVRRHGHFPAAVLEVVNEWAEESLGDILIEDGDPYVVHCELLKGAE